MYGHNQEGSSQYPRLQQIPQYPPQQNLGMIPQQLNKKNDTGFQKLARDGIFIKQKIDALEVVTGCVQSNTYYVYPLDDKGDKKGKKLYKCKEDSSCCARQCLSGSCRPFKLNVNLEDANEEVDGEPFLLIDRPCKCTCLCCNRPEITVTLVEGGKNEHLGRIRNPWTCCDETLEVFDKDNNLKYIINANCCQLGFFCNAPCDSCQTIDFDIKTPSGETISTLQKRSRSCLTAAFTDSNNFSVPFPKGCSSEDKALILSATLFLDFRYFNEPPNNGENSNRGGAI